jgi:hypothetical protein
MTPLKEMTHEDFKAIAKNFWDEEYDIEWTHDEMVEELAFKLKVAYMDGREYQIDRQLERAWKNSENEK